MHKYDPYELARAFDRVAPFFNLTRPLFAGAYRRAAEYTLAELKDTIDPPRVLDIGTGTGTLAGVFARMGARVTGMDVSPGMLRQARKKYPQVKFIQAPAHSIEEMEDNSFEVVSAAFVIHEMPPDYRVNLLRQMKRVAREVVLIIDYVPNNNPLISLVESMEKSYYPEFLESVDRQLNQVFSTHVRKKLSHFIGMYLCPSRDN